MPNGCLSYAIRDVSDNKENLASFMSCNGRYMYMTMDFEGPDAAGDYPQGYLKISAPTPYQRDQGLVGSLTMTGPGGAGNVPFFVECLPTPAIHDPQSESYLRFGPYYSWPQLDFSPHLGRTANSFIDAYNARMSRVISSPARAPRTPPTNVGARGADPSMSPLRDCTNRSPNSVSYLFDAPPALQGTTTVPAASSLQPPSPRLADAPSLAPVAALSPRLATSAVVSSLPAATSNAFVFAAPQERRRLPSAAQTAASATGLMFSVYTDPVVNIVTPARAVVGDSDSDDDVPPLIDDSEKESESETSTATTSGIASLDLPLSGRSPRPATAFLYGQDPTQVAPVDAHARNSELSESGASAAAYVAPFATSASPAVVNKATSESGNKAPRTSAKAATPGRLKKAAAAATTTDLTGSDDEVVEVGRADVPKPALKVPVAVAAADLKTATSSPRATTGRLKKKAVNQTPVDSDDEIFGNDPDVEMAASSTSSSKKARPSRKRVINVDDEELGDHDGDLTIIV